MPLGSLSAALDLCHEAGLWSWTLKLDFVVLDLIFPGRMRLPALLGVIAMFGSTWAGGQ
jgi:hypothetical protein